MPVLNDLDTALLIMVALAAANDLMTRCIPNRLLLVGVGAAFALHLFSPAPDTRLLDGITGLFTGLLVFLPLYCLRGMAAGDVKLMAAVGAFSAPAEVLQIALVAVCTGGLISLIVVLAQRRGRAAVANIRGLLRPLWMRLAGVPAVAEPMPNPSVGTIPYGLAIAVGTMLVVSDKYISSPLLRLLL